MGSISQNFPLYSGGHLQVYSFIPSMHVPPFCTKNTDWIQIIKPGQNKKGQKILQLHRFFNTFSQLPAVKKYSINGAAGKIFGPYHFVTALPNFDKILFNHRYKMAKLSFNTFAFCG